ncbi:MAG: ester cyclase [Chloroflexi bacterium]|nr:ester cyclase [Chloroflexota bacterium]
MSNEQNKDLTRRFVEEVLNTGNLDRMSEFLTPDFVEHAARAGVPPTVEGVRMFFQGLRSAFPNFKYTVNDAIADGDLIIQRTTGQGTMTGEFAGMKPTGKSATWSELHTVRIKDGKIVEHWANVDQLSMLMQLGLMQPPAA